MAFPRRPWRGSRNTSLKESRECELVKLRPPGRQYQQVYPKDLYSDPCFFLIYTADLPHTTHPDSVECSQFVDDTCLISTHKQPATSVSNLQNSVTSTGQRLRDWKLAVNVEKTMVMEVYRRCLPANLDIHLYGMLLN